MIANQQIRVWVLALILFGAGCSSIEPETEVAPMALLPNWEQVSTAELVADCLDFDNQDENEAVASLACSNQALGRADLTPELRTQALEQYNQASRYLISQYIESQGRYRGLMPIRIKINNLNVSDLRLLPIRQFNITGDIGVLAAVPVANSAPASGASRADNIIVFVFEQVDIVNHLLEAQFSALEMDKNLIREIGDNPYRLRQLKP
ncbi:hypothetical protein [Alteromonas gilva]|uniref:Uncharacterized protein n=1 Tax=Alteromonas gilva TaxID=2987522 RepID=A0ABT5L943_9ALTE|nr:hypothetical protein [Alteromonas gilva]MDC8832493.1 hypothetical protein [Alteromonas gilva]